MNNNFTVEEQYILNHLVSYPDNISREEVIKQHVLALALPEQTEALQLVQDDFKNLGKKLKNLSDDEWQDILNDMPFEVAL